jgi:ABC-type antimicrobial peptide transport system permease subunit
MLKNYFTIALRNLGNNKVFSFINIGGLAAGMAVAMLIGLWIYDELSFEKYHKQYNQIVQVLDNSNIGNGLSTGYTLPLPVSAELRNNNGGEFKQVASTLTVAQNIVYGDKAFSKTGCYAEPGITDILTFDMLEGTPASLQKPGAILLNESTAKAVFGTADPINKIIKLNNSYTLLVTGVYKDLPENTQFNGWNFVAPVGLLFPAGVGADNWYSNSFNIYALLSPGSNPQQVSARIKNVIYNHTKENTKPALFLNPMRFWHLYEFKNGVLAAGQLQFVWLFGIIGVFVLRLACINFMNLSTARSEKRAKEVGIRKAIGSLRWQLMGQFFSESFLVVIAAFIISIALIWLALPLFNEVSGKEMRIVWGNPAIWLLSLAFCLFTALVAGSYPAVYLSSFNPVKVLKGTFRAGRFAAIPRKVLVVVQFTVSVILVIGTLVVFRQIQFAKNRPVGYSRNGLVTIPYNPAEMPHYQAFRDELLSTRVATGVSASSSPTTGIFSSADNLDWKGKDPNRQEMFGTILIDPDFGNVVGWQLKEGRTFSKQYTTDSTCFLFNEAAIKQMGLAHPIGEMVKWHGKSWKIIGVVKDMVMTSPFDPITPVVFLMDDKQRSFNVINMKINPSMSAQEALGKTEALFKKFAPSSPFIYSFADSDYALKFAAEERTGKLASVFAILAIFISCLGLFGMASFVAEQRTKEIGVRKILGASVFNVWGLISNEFVILVIIACAIAVPVAYYFLHQWLQGYQYRTALSWWIFVVAGIGALIVTLLTVSFQAVKAALANPVKSLRTE